MREISPSYSVAAASKSNGAGKLHTGAEIPKRWRWHWRALIEMRERLLAERGEHLSEAAEPTERHSTHMADSASDELARELALSCLSAEADELYEIEAALERIANGTYGICEQTGACIPAARLRAIPWTRYVAAAKRRLEKNVSQ